MPWNSSTIAANGIDIAIHRTGPRGEPVVVLAHGFSDDGPCWGPFADVIVPFVDEWAVTMTRPDDAPQ